MKSLDVDSFAVLARTGSVHRVFLTPYPAIDGGGWFLDVDHTDHTDHGLTRELHTKRAGLRVFMTSDAAIKALHECGYTGSVVVVMKPEGGK